jgi:hypothetical protein
MVEICKICNSPSEKIFSKQVLKKYNADYFKCTSCGFVQTSEPVWIQEAYSSAITSLDLGLLGRNIGFSHQVTAIIDACLPEAKHMLDYAGGYGVFVRLMRDRGFDFYRHDPFCENLFSKHFEKMFKFSDTLIFSTMIVPFQIEDIKNWWYLSEETGQHVAFYSEKSLQIIAQKYGKKYYVKNGNLHMFSSKQLNSDQIDYAFNDIRIRTRLKGLVKQQLDFHVRRPSLLEQDYQKVKKKING